MEHNLVQERPVMEPGPWRPLEQSVQMPTPYFEQVRGKEGWWVQNAPKETLQLIMHGVGPSLRLPDNLSKKIQVKSPLEEQKALQVLQEYLEVGAVCKNPPGETKHLVPWFVISKEENGQEKLRLIADCREINQFFLPQHFKLDHWQVIFPFLQKGMWAAKIDLKHAYFHLGLEKDLQPYVRMQVAGEIYGFRAACFGINILPQRWMQVMKVFQKLWRQKGILCFVYLDDILIVNNTPKGVEKDLKFILKTLEDGGTQINFPKSKLTPTQVVDHLGFTLNLKDGVLEVPKGKLKAVRRELGKLLVKDKMSCRKMAAILGSIRSFF